MLFSASPQVAGSGDINLVELMSYTMLNIAGCQCLPRAIACLVRRPNIGRGARGHQQPDGGGDGGPHSQPHAVKLEMLRRGGSGRHPDCENVFKVYGQPRECLVIGAAEAYSVRSRNFEATS